MCVLENWRSALVPLLDSVMSGKKDACMVSLARSLEKSSKHLRWARQTPNHPEDPPKTGVWSTRKAQRFETPKKPKKHIIQIANIEKPLQVVCLTQCETTSILI